MNVGEGRPERDSVCWVAWASHGVYSAFPSILLVSLRAWRDMGHPGLPGEVVVRGMEAVLLRRCH